MHSHHIAGFLLEILTCSVMDLILLLMLAILALSIIGTTLTIFTTLLLLVSLFVYIYIHIWRGLKLQRRRAKHETKVFHDIEVGCPLA